MLGLAVAMARRRIPALIAVLCAVLGGTAIVTGTGVLAESGLRSHLPVGRLAGADVLVAADQSLHVSEDLPVALPERRSVPADLVARLEGLPGVEAAVADVSFPAALVDDGGDVVATDDPRTAGHGWASTGLLADPQVRGAAPDGAGEVALDADLADAAGLEPGDEAQVVVDGRTGSYRVTAVVSPAGAGLLFADDVAAQQARGPGAADLIGLRVTDSAEGVADAVRPLLPDGLVVRTGDSRGDLALPEATAARSLLVVLAGSLAGVPLLIVGFLIAGALTVSIGGQRRELALLRAVGTTPRQVRRLVAHQASVVAAIAVVPGVALGYLLAGQFRRLLVHIGVLPEALPLSVSPLPALAAVVLLFLVVQVAARSAAWRTSREPVTTALGEARTGPRTPSRGRYLTGLLLLLAAVPLSVPPLLLPSALGAAATSLAGIVAAIGLTLAGPVLLQRVSGALARRLPARASAPTWLAVASLHGYALRSAGAISTLAMAVVFVLTYAYPLTTVAGATSGQERDGTLADATFTADGLGGVPDGLLDEVRSTPGVEAAAPVGSTTAIWPQRVLGSEELTPEPALVLTPAAADVLDLGVTDGDLAGLTGAAVAVAAGRDAGVGDDVHLLLGDGTEVDARVVAVYDRSLGFGAVVLSADLAEGHTATTLADRLLVRTDGTGGTGRALAAVAADSPGIRVTAADLGDRPAAPPETWINLAVLGVLLGYLLLGIANALVAATAQRREEIATLRLTGTTPRQVLAMMRREAGLVSAAAVAAGVAVSALPLALLGLGFLDRPWPAGPAWLLPAAALVVTGIAFLAIELPTRHALRTPPGAAAQG